MSDFKIELSIDPETHKAAWDKINEWVVNGVDFFMAAESAFTGILRISDSEQYIEFTVDQVFRALSRLMHTGFLMNYAQQVNGMNGDSLALNTSAIPQLPGPIFPARITYHLDGNTIHLVVLTSGYEGFETSHFIGPEGMRFEIPLIEFNRAVGVVYNEMLDFLDVELEGIDGFEERFCLIPFRKEM